MKYECLRVASIGKRSESKIQNCISFSLFRGEALCIITEDLDTKFFLLDVLMGKTMPDRGAIYIEDRFCVLNSIENAHSKGLYYVCEAQLIPNMNIAHNLFMTDDKFYNVLSVLDNRSIHQAAAELLKEFSLCGIKTSALSSSLSPIDRYLLSVLRAVAANAKVIILDNPYFNICHPEDVRKVQCMVSVLRQKRISVLWFTSKWEPIFQNFDRFAVISSGVVTQVSPVTTIPPAIPEKNLLRFRHSLCRFSDMPVVLECRNFSYQKHEQKCHLSFKLHAGEILGIHHVNDGLAAAFSAFSEGMNFNDGNFFLEGGLYQPEVEERRQIVFLYSGYSTTRIFSDMSLYDNVALLVNKPVYNVAGLMNKRIRNLIARTTLESLHAQKLITQYGNQRNLRGMNRRDQFIVETAKWLCTHPKVFIFINPHDTYDTLPESQFQTLLETLRSLGLSILVISGSEESLLKLCTRVISVS